MKVDFTPAWELNEKVVDFIFFSSEASRKVKQKVEVFERISKLNLIRGELWYQGVMVSSVEDSGYTSIDGVVESIAIPEDIPTGAILIYKIINLDKNQTAVQTKRNI
jgi:hypothetical protein